MEIWSGKFDGLSLPENHVFNIRNLRDCLNFVFGPDNIGIIVYSCTPVGGFSSDEGILRHIAQLRGEK